MGQLVYLNPTPSMTLECALEITPGRRLVVAADLRARLLRVYLLYELVQPKPRRSRTPRVALLSPRLCSPPYVRRIAQIRFSQVPLSLLLGQVQPLPLDC